MNYKIDKNIPIPMKGCGVSETKELFKRMEVGDSVVVKSAAEIAKIYYCARRLSGGIVSRKVKGGFRVWRVK